jgi:hypothetical protein
LRTLGVYAPWVSRLRLVGTILIDRWVIGFGSLEGV